MPGREIDPEEFFARPKGKWDGKAYAERQPLSSVVGRPVKLVRAPVGTVDWRLGFLRVVDADTEEILATLYPGALKIPGKDWPLRDDC